MTIEETLMEQDTPARVQPQRIGLRRMIDKSEYVRLLQQSLHKLGYGDVANLLEQQSVRHNPLAFTF